MKFTSEEQVLDEEFRRAVIEEMIDSRENIARKQEALRRHEIYRDKNLKWVVKEIEKEGFKATTVAQMKNRAANISIARKIINKLSQTYVGGVDREAADKGSQESIDMLADELDVDTRLKKSDRYRQLFRNCLIGVVPILSTRETEGDAKKYELCVKVLASWEYDVIEDPYDRTSPKVVILTDFLERDADQPAYSLAGSQGRRLRELGSSQDGDGKDQLIADAPADAGRGAKYGGNPDRQFIFWTDKYHVTCTADGKKVPNTGEPKDVNPINRLPWINISTDQDGQYWAQGGDDVIEGSVLVNKKLTDINFICFVQGWGQLVIAGKNVPNKIVGGPDNAFVFEMNDGDPQPQVYFATSNPPIEAWLEAVRTFLAMLLTTNDLSVRNIAAKLDAENAASGIAMMIENSEVVSEMKDTQKLYQDKEPELWEIIRLWHELYASKDALIKKLQEVKTFKDANVKLRFHSVKPPISKKEELEEMKAANDLGIRTLLDLVKQDNPDLTEEQAKQKVAELQAAKKADREAFIADAAKKLTESGLKNGAKDGQTGKDNGDGATPAEADGADPAGGSSVEPAGQLPQK